MVDTVDRLNRQLPSGVSRDVQSPLQIPADTAVTVRLFGRPSSELLTRFLASGILRPALTRTVMAPRVARLPGVPLRVPNLGTAEALALKKAGVIQKIIYVQDTNDSGVRSCVVDCSPLLDVLDSKSGDLSVDAMASAVTAAATAWKPPVPAEKHIDFVIVEVPGDTDPALARKQLTVTKKPPGIYAILQRVIADAGKATWGDSIVLLVSPTMHAVMRIDADSDRTDTATGRLMAVLRVREHVAEQPEFSAVAVPSPPPSKAETRRLEKAEARVEAEGRVVMATSDGRTATLDEIRARPFSVQLEPSPTRAPVISKALKRSMLPSITRSYVEKGTYDRDIVETLMSVSHPGARMTIEAVERRNSSDVLNLKETISVSYRDETSGRKATMTVDVPLIDKDGFIFLNGVKWAIVKQVIALPVIKVKPDEVLITTAYNKAMVTRFGQNVSSRATASRTLLQSAPPGMAIAGSVTSSNVGMVSPPEYDALAKSYRMLRTKDSVIFFDRKEAERKFTDRFGKAPGAPEGAFPLGWMGDAPLVMDQRGMVTVAGRPDAPPVSIDAVIASVLSAVPDYEPPRGTSSSRKSSYSRTKILSRQLPTAVIVGFVDGLDMLLSKSGAETRVLRDQPSASARAPDSAVVRFSDATLVYSTRRLRDALLLNGLQEVSTEERPIADFGPSGPGWVDFIADRLGSPGHARALENYRASFIDPMTRGILSGADLPTDFGGLLIHASSLLETNDSTAQNDMSNYRIRGHELIPVLLYKMLHREMEKVRSTRNSAMPQRLNVNPNELITSVLSASNVEELADLNPLLEAESIGRVSWIGAGGGLSDGRMVGRDIRRFHSSMQGLFGYYSPDSSQIGIKRTLSFGARVKDTRGMLGENVPLADEASNLGLGELMAPFTARHDDPPRIGMQSKQAHHTMPVLGHSPSLVGTGAERVLPYMIGNTFVYKAAGAGRVDSVDAERQVMRLVYDDKSVAYADLAERNVKNSGGGFFVPSRLTPDVEAGHRFAAGDVLAYDTNFFARGGDGELSYKAGTLVKTIIAPLDQTFEDSILVSDGLIERTVAEVTMARSVSLRASANLQSHASVGDAVGTNTALAVFENVSDDKDIAGLLARIGTEFDEDVAALAVNTALAKYAGVVTEMRVYYNKPESELSPSLRKFIEQQRAIGTKRAKAVEDATVGGLPVRTHLPEMVTKTKIHGEAIDGVLIFFYIRTRNRAGPGDKYVSQSPLKGIVSMVFEPGEEPLSEDGESVDYIISPVSIMGRKTMDVFYQMFTNAVMVKLRQNIIKEYFGEGA